MKQHNSDFSQFIWARWPQKIEALRRYGNEPTLSASDPKPKESTAVETLASKPSRQACRRKCGPIAQYKGTETFGVVAPKVEKPLGQGREMLSMASKSLSYLKTDSRRPQQLKTKGGSEELKTGK